MDQRTAGDDTSPVTWGDFRAGAERVLALSLRIQLYSMTRSEEHFAAMNTAAAEVNAFFGAPIVKAEA